MPVKVAIRPAALAIMILGALSPLAGATDDWEVGGLADEDCFARACRLIEPGEPVARQTARLLESARLLRPETLEHSVLHHGHLELLCTAAPKRLEQAARQWLHLPRASAQLLSNYAEAP